MCRPGQGSRCCQQCAAGLTASVLMLPVQVLGSREFSRYYRQRHKPVDSRQSVAVNTVIARWGAGRCMWQWCCTTADAMSCCWCATGMHHSCLQLTTWVAYQGQAACMTHRSSIARVYHMSPQHAVFMPCCCACCDALSGLRARCRRCACSAHTSSFVMPHVHHHMPTRLLPPPLPHRYRSLGVDVSPVSTVEAQQRKVAKKWDARAMKSKLQLLQKSNVIRNLPNNVPY